ncbi:MAG: hypothetical protein EBU90_18080 [Proteobacteria bacterium]|nr:hypothetical protein [Pseudomonadota bacterium]NBP15530.1 hypothetical protein [bacterium]
MNIKALLLMGIFMLNLSAKDTATRHQQITDVATTIGTINIENFRVRLVEFNHAQAIIEAFAPEKEELYKKALEELLQENPWLKNDPLYTNSLSQEEALELLKKIAQFKKEFETPVSWKQYFNPFKVDKKFDLCITLLQSKALQRLEAAIPAREKLIETYHKSNQQKIERYKAIIAANKRTNDIIKQDPLLCVV